MSTYIPANRKRFKPYEDCPSILNRFLKNLVDQGRSIRTANSYFVSIRQFLRYLKMTRKEIETELYEYISIEDFQENDLSPTSSEIDNYERFMKESQKKSDRSIYHERSVLKRFYSYLSNESILPNNPFDETEQNSFETKQIPIITEKEKRMLLEACFRRPLPERDYCITYLLANTGIRLSELCALNLESLEKKDSPPTLLRIHGKGNLERTIQLSEAALAAIENWLKKRDEMRISPNEKALFVSPRTTHRLTSRQVEKIIAKELALANLDGYGYSPSTLRLSVIYNDLKNNSDLKMIQEEYGFETQLAVKQLYNEIEKGIRIITE